MMLNIRGMSIAENFLTGVKDSRLLGSAASAASGVYFWATFGVKSLFLALATRKENERVSRIKI